MAQKLGGNPQPKYAIDHDYYAEYGCDGRACDFRSDDEKDFSFCEHSGCERERLCDGCAFQCSDCDRFFCREHILGERVNEYLCPPCHRKRGGRQAA